VDDAHGLPPCVLVPSPLLEPHNWIVSRSGMSGCAPSRRARSCWRGDLALLEHGDCTLPPISPSSLLLAECSRSLQRRYVLDLDARKRPLAKTSGDLSPRISLHRTSPGSSFRLERPEGRQTTPALHCDTATLRHSLAICDLRLANFPSDHTQPAVPCCG
jgi:hypothetical protein